MEAILPEDDLRLMERRYFLFCSLTLGELKFALSGRKLVRGEREKLLAGDHYDSRSIRRKRLLTRVTRTEDEFCFRSVK